MIYKIQWLEGDYKFLKNRSHTFLLKPTAYSFHHFPQTRLPQIFTTLSPSSEFEAKALKQCSVFLLLPNGFWESKCHRDRLRFNNCELFKDKEWVRHACENISRSPHLLVGCSTNPNHTLPQNYNPCSVLCSDILQKEKKTVVLHFMLIFSEIPSSWATVFHRTRTNRS